MDDIPVPVEGFLAVSLECATAVIVAVDVDVAVALAHLSGRGRDEVNAAPGGVPHDGNAVLDGLIHGSQVVTQIGDAVVVVYREVSCFIAAELVLGAETILDDEKRFLPAVVVFVQDVAQTLRVDLPAPFGILEIRIFLAAEDIADARLAGSTLADAHVITEGNKVHRVLT